MNNNHSPIRTALGQGKKNLTLGKNESTEQKKKPKLKDSDKNEHV